MDQNTQEDPTLSGSKEQTWWAYHQKKLWRNLSAQRMEAGGGRLHRRELSEADFRHQLLLKLLEEAQEVHEACRGEDQESVLSEMADVLEVLFTLADALGVTWEQVEARRQEKKKVRGAFDRFSYVETAFVPQGHPAIAYYEQNAHRYPAEAHAHSPNPPENQ